MKTKVLLIVGGEGKEHDVSLMGRDYVRSLIDTEKHDITTVTIGKDGVWRGEDGSTLFPCRTTSGCGLMTDGGMLRIDVALPLLHGDRGEDGVIQGLLTAAGIPFVGADTSLGALCADKWHTKCVAIVHGIPVMRGIRIHTEDESEAMARAEASISYPMFIKPTGLGSSIGACPIPTRGDFSAAFATARAAAESLVIEEAAVPKRELEVAYFSAGWETIITEPAEILTDGFYDYDKKYSHAQGQPCRTVARAELDTDTRIAVRELALQVAQVFKLRHLGRIDLFLCGDRLLLNEINTMPGFTPSSLYVRMMEAAGITPRELISRLLADAMERSQL